MKVDGHTHTELCPHGSGDHLEAMVERAIELGFTDYWVTEHAPLPVNFSDAFGGPLDDIQTASLRIDQVDDYLELANQIKERFAAQIKVHIGFELDYLAGFEADRRHFWDHYGPQVDGGILSVHYLPGRDGRYYGVDYSPEELEQGFGELITHPQELYRYYFSQLQRAVNCDLGPNAPKRLGHLTLIKSTRTVSASTPTLTPPLGKPLSACWPKWSPTTGKLISTPPGCLRPIATIFTRGGKSPPGPRNWGCRWSLVPTPTPRSRWGTPTTCLKNLAKRFDLGRLQEIT